MPAIPPAWLTQSAPGAVILTDVHGPLGGTLAKLVVDEHGAATGRFVPHWAGFMAMRHTIAAADQHWTRFELTAAESWTEIDPTSLDNNGLFGFVAQWHLPGVTQGRMTDDDSRPAVFIVDGDGNRAEVATNLTRQAYHVRQYGERKLWDRVEEAAAFWNGAGQPPYERFGITATIADQYVWCDDPDGPHRWPITIDQHARQRPWPSPASAPLGLSQS